MTYSTISTRVFRAFVDLTNPDNVKDLKENYGIEVKIYISKVFPMDRSRNEAVDMALSSKYSADYLLFLDGDNIWPKNTIQDLLKANSDEYPVTSGLYWRKPHPHCCIQGQYAPNERHLNRMGTIKSMGFVDASGQQTLFYSPLMDFDTTQRIDVSGLGCLLVRTDVFKKLTMPWFSYYDSYLLGGDFSIEGASEEMVFFSNLHKAGIKTLLVPTVRCGHEVLRVIGCPEE